MTPLFIPLPLIHSDFLKEVGLFVLVTPNGPDPLKLGRETSFQNLIVRGYRSVNHRIFIWAW